MKTLNFEQLVEDILTDQPGYDNVYFHKTVEGRTWAEQCETACAMVRTKSNVRLTILAIYYWMGKGLEKGKKLPSHLKNYEKAADRIYQIFSPLGIKHLGRTRNLSYRAITKLEEREIAQAVKLARFWANRFSMDDHDKSERMLKIFLSF